MADTVELPGLGEVKKEYVWAGGAAVVGFVTFAWWRARGTADSGPVVLDPDDVVPGGGHTPAPTGDPSGSYDSTGDEPTTNAEWSRAATEYLSQAGYDPKLITAALGKFLQRMELSGSEADAVRAAIAVTGYPPEDGPWPIKLGGTGSPAPDLSAPSVTATASGRNVTVSWSPVSGVDRYLVRMAGFTGQFFGRKEVTSGSSVTFRNVPGKRRHSFVVWPLKPGENDLSESERRTRPHGRADIPVG